MTVWRAIISYSRRQSEWPLLTSSASLLRERSCTDSNDTIACLRAVPYAVLAPILVNGSVADFALDDVWFNSSFLEQLEAEEYSKIPMVSCLSPISIACLMKPDTWCKSR